MTYIEFVQGFVNNQPQGAPIYTNKIADALAGTYGLEKKKAAAAAAVAVKRIMTGGFIPDLRFYQKGIYYRTASTPFGETGINKEQLIANKYLIHDNGYETGLGLLHSLGLTSQMPNIRSQPMQQRTVCDMTEGLMYRYALQRLILTQRTKRISKYWMLSILWIMRL